MKKVFLVYKTDTLHSYASRDIIGIATDEVYAVGICRDQAKKEGEKLDSEDLFMLNNFKQTQGYKGEGEFQFEEVLTNKLL